ncbi:MAG: hypothetical protein ACYC64_00910, partial [Armatimonadota bacterium]
MINLRADLKNKGSMLLITMVALFLVTTLAVAVLSITSSTLYMNNRQQFRAIALNISESGAEIAALWLRDQPYPPTQTQQFAPVAMNNGSYTVTIHPDPGNTTAFLKTFIIESVGQFGNVSKSVEVVIRQASFGRYGYFTDKETSSVSGGAIWWAAGEVVDGPVHSNNTNGTNFNINYNNSNSPIFLDMVTAAGSSINYSPSRPRDENTFKRIFANGSKGFKLGVDPIALPPSTDAQKEAAWGGTSGFPTTTGVYLRGSSNSGICIVGDSTIQLALDASGNQQIIIKQGSNTTTITQNKSTNSTSVTGPVGSGSVTSMSHLPNGVVYSTGNITSLKGEVADNLVSGDTIATRSEITIATNVNSGKNITVTDNIIYHTRPDKTLDPTDPVNLAAGTLGLVANNVTISSSAPANLEIDAVCMAGSQTTAAGSFSVANYSTKKPTGTLTVLGGLIQKARGPVGTFNPSTGQTVTGYRKNYHYDPRLAQQPPPYYPTTGQYDRLSWRV